jgi:tRNA nucleotidyltransferase/poly(A) polymerase
MDWSLPLLEKFRAYDPGLFSIAETIAYHVAKEPVIYAQNPPRVLIFGGFIRDFLWGEAPKDLDLEVYGVVPETVITICMSLFPERIRLVGKSFQTLKLVLYDGIQVDITLPRNNPHQRESFFAGSSAVTPAESLLYKDFTINSLALDPLTGDLINVCNGLSDLHLCQLRSFKPSTLKQNPLRVYRAAVLVAKGKLTIERATLQELKEIACSADFKQIHPRRIEEQLLNLFSKTTEPSRALELFIECNLLSEFKKHLPSKGYQNAFKTLDKAARAVNKARTRFDGTMVHKSLKLKDKTILMLSCFFYQITLDVSEWKNITIEAKIVKLDELIKSFFSYLPTSMKIIEGVKSLLFSAIENPPSLLQDQTSNFEDKNHVLIKGERSFRSSRIAPRSLSGKYFVVKKKISKHSKDTLLFHETLKEIGVT